MSSDRIGLDQVLVQREVDEYLAELAELAAVAILARDSGRTSEAYRQDLRFFFTWIASVGLEVLAATRPYTELFRHHMEQRVLAASTIDGCDRSASGPASDPFIRTCSAVRSSWQHSMAACRCATCNSQPVMGGRAELRSSCGSAPTLRRRRFPR